MEKLTTAKRVLRTQGVAGMMSVLKEQYLNNWLSRQIDGCYGKIIEMRGNVVSIDGCTFSLESPAIATRTKSRFMFDQYERPEREAIRRFLDPTIPVVEFGGSIGVVSCLTNRKLHYPQRHVVVEANPALVPLLKKNRDNNQCKFEVLPCLVAYGSEQASFYVNNENFVASTTIPTEGSVASSVVEVQTIDLRSILEQYEFDYCTLICDIEGGEADLVRHEADTLRNRVGTLILEVHEWALGKERVAELFGELRDLGFQTVYGESDTYTFQKQP